LFVAAVDILINFNCLRDGRDLGFKDVTLVSQPVIQFYAAGDESASDTAIVLRAVNIDLLIVLVAVELL